VPLAVCATPIGNLDDVTLRLLEELRSADVILCEDTRHTRVLLDRHGISGAKLLSYHEHNEVKRTAELLPRLLAGERIALVSDAGMPGISDPGARLVGAAAVDTALVAGGFAADRYQFVGFLPRGDAALAALWRELAGWPYPVVAFESPRRLPATLRSLAAAQPAREVAVCRELTKKFEEIVRGPSAEVSARFSEAPKGEITLVLGPGGKQRDLTDALEAVADLVAAGVPRRHAADVVSRLTGASRNELYRRTL